MNKTVNVTRLTIANDLIVYATEPYSVIGFYDTKLDKLYSKVIIDRNGEDYILKGASYVPEENIKRLTDKLQYHQINHVDKISWELELCNPFEVIAKFLDQYRDNLTLAYNNIWITEKSTATSQRTEFKEYTIKENLQEPRNGIEFQINLDKKTLVINNSEHNSHFKRLKSVNPDFIITTLKLNSFRIHRDTLKLEGEDIENGNITSIWIQSEQLRLAYELKRHLEQDFNFIYGSSHEFISKKERLIKSEYELIKVRFKSELTQIMYTLTVGLLNQSKLELSNSERVNYIYKIEQKTVVDHRAYATYIFNNNELGSMTFLS